MATRRAESGAAISHPFKGKWSTAATAAGATIETVPCEHTDSFCQLEKSEEECRGPASSFVASIRPSVHACIRPSRLKLKRLSHSGTRSNLHAATSSPQLSLSAAFWNGVEWLLSVWHLGVRRARNKRKEKQTAAALTFCQRPWANRAAPGSSRGWNSRRHWPRTDTVWNTAEDRPLSAPLCLRRPRAAAAERKSTGRERRAFCPSKRFDSTTNQTSMSPAGKRPSVGPPRYSIVHLKRHSINSFYSSVRSQSKCPARHQRNTNRRNSLERNQTWPAIKRQETTIIIIITSFGSCCRCRRIIVASKGGRATAASSTNRHQVARYINNLAITYQQTINRSLTAMTLMEASNAHNDNAHCNNCN